jgi:hypothetical protein
MLTFEEDGHVYRYSGKVIPSVTQIIAPLYDNAFDFVKKETLERKRRLGQALHYAAELDDAGNLDEASLSEALRPYLAGWRKFKTEHRVTVVAAEQKLAAPQFWFAGTVDRVLEIDGQRWTIDLKTTVEIHRAVGVQLAGYSLMVGDCRVGALRLLPDGTYRLEPFDKYLADDRRCFLGLLAQHHWRSKYAPPQREESHERQPHHA